jgi:D-tyrosyl-tRNA(Tyr) deacylase
MRLWHTEYHMRAVLQRVSEARVEVDSRITGEIARGLLVLLGVERGDTTANADAMLDKVVNLRIFPDDAGKMNRSLHDVGGALLVVSQFTLLGDCRKGRRPSFDRAAPPEEARALYQHFVDRARAGGIPVGTGVFQAHMDVSLVNDGPVTLLVET